MNKSALPPVEVTRSAAQVRSQQMTRAAIRQRIEDYTDTHYRVIIQQQRRIITKLERRIQCLQRKQSS
jgi:hypothetical protein